MKFEQLSGAGNHFLLFDARPDSAHAEPTSGRWSPDGAAAREWCAAAAKEGALAPDGVLVLMESEVAMARLVIWNSDGSFAAACGNGLRCVGWLLLRESGQREVLIETHTGTRWVRGETSERGAERLEAELGPVIVEALDDSLALLEGEREAWKGDVGNPHCVFLVDTVNSKFFESRGMELQVDPAFPGGVNVGYLAEESGEWKLRVYERGAGETGACGTGAAAAAAVLHAAFGLPLPLSLALPAGRLTVAETAEGGLSVTGGVEHRGTLVVGALSSESRDI